MARGKSPNLESGAYMGQDRARVVATLDTLRYFRAFLASDCRVMRDPYSGWMGTELDKREARQKLTWLVNVAINRKANIPDHETDWNIVRLARAVNTPRLVVRERECPLKYRARLAHRLTHPEDEEV